jgi:dGTPase
VDLSDRVAYNNHDLDDGLTAGLLDPEEVREVRIVDEAFRGVDARHPGLPEPLRKYNAIVWLINWSVTDVIRESSAAIERAGIRTISDVRACREPLIRFSHEGQERQEELHEFLSANFYDHYRVARMQEKAKTFLSQMFREYVRKPRSLPPEARRSAEREGLHRAVCDHIASMTDREAQTEWLRLFQPFERV